MLPTENSMSDWYSQCLFTHLAMPFYLLSYSSSSCKNQFAALPGCMCRKELIQTLVSLCRVMLCHVSLYVR